MKSYQEKTSADNKSIGFDYQYYYFLYLLLGLEEGQSIGIEVKDDIHLDLGENKQILLQLKHSIQTNTSGSIINITERDSGLWKTINNWVNVINDENDGRKEQKERLKYIKNTRFILVSNKSSNQNNRFLKNIKEFKQERINISRLKEYLIDLYINTIDEQIKGYILQLHKQENEWLSYFLINIDFELDTDDLIYKIKSRIKGKQVREYKIEDVFSAIDSKIRREIYFTTKSIKKMVITFDEFYRKYHSYFDQGRNNKLPIRKKPLKFTKPLHEQSFIKQLVDIHVVKSEDTDEMMKLTGYMLQIYNHLNIWVNEGLLTEEQVERFDNDCILKWKNLHEEVYSDIKLDKLLNDKEPEEEEIIRKALKCLFNIKREKLMIDDNTLDVEMSNGQFYLLSDIPKIGWRLDWEDKYKK